MFTFRNIHYAQTFHAALYTLMGIVLSLQIHAQTHSGNRPSQLTDSVDVKDGNAANSSHSNDSLLLWPANVQNRLAKLTTDNMFSLSQLGLYVYDLTADSAIFDCGSRQLLRPASCQKLLTAITALSNLGASYRLSTSLYHTGTIADSILHGDLYVVGGFDPAFGSDDMRAFCQSLDEAGIRKIDGALYADLSFKDTLRWGKGWCWDDKMTRLTPLMYRKKDVFMQNFRNMLHDMGIEADSLAGMRVLPTQNAKRMVVRYHTMDQVLQRMMKESDNIYAEALLYQLGSRSGYASVNEAIGKVQSLIRKSGEDASHCRVADGSGLSLYNYTTPRILVSALRYAYLHNDIYLHLYPSLPIAGIDGTLRDRMSRGATYGNVHAKTGTVEGVSSLAGYITAANGHMLCFAIINQGILHTKNGHAFQDRVCRALAEP